MTKATQKICTLIVIASLSWMATSLAATIPVGTTLVVRTLNTIHSTDRVGRTFNAQLDQDIAVNGKTVLPKGTKVFGKIESSQAIPRSNSPLTLNLTGVSVNGRTIPVKTTGAFELQNVAKGRAKARGVTAGPFLAPHGTRVEFRLAQPLNV
jgi:hypothetical protein